MIIKHIERLILDTSDKEQVFLYVLSVLKQGLTGELLEQITP